MQDKFIESFLEEKRKIDQEYCDALFKLTSKYNRMEENEMSERLGMRSSYSIPEEFVLSFSKYFNQIPKSELARNRVPAFIEKMGITSYKQFLGVKREDVLSCKDCGARTWDVVYAIQKLVSMDLHGKEV